MTESGAIERKVSVSVPRAEVQSAIAAQLREVGARARMPGFRPGKAPADMIARRYGAQVTHDVINDTIESSYREALGREKITPAGLVAIEPQPFADGGDLRYVATIDVYPPIPSPTLAGRRLEKPVCEVAADDVERTLQNIRARHAAFAPKSGKAARGDRLSIDFDGAIDGQPFAGGSAKEHQFVLGAGHAIRGFEDLAGARIGDARQISHEFAAEYPGEEVAGRRAEFSVTVRAIESPVLPQLNTAFAEKLGIATGGMAKMRAEIQSSLQRELHGKMRALLRDMVMKELLAANPISAPRGLVAAEVERRIGEFTERLKAAGQPAPEIDQAERAKIAEAARRGVVLALIAAEVIKVTGIKPDRELVRARLEEMARGYDDSEKMMDWYQSDPARLRHIEELALEEQMVTRMIESADALEKRVSFKDFMALRPAG
ncbi:MAG: trigger factor [Gammaproteobacteria bacterium]